MKYVDLKFKKLTDDAILPTYAHDGDAGLDLYANENIWLDNGSYTMIGTGVAVDIPIGYVGLIHPRSGLAAKYGLTVLNAPGTVDAGYRGELKVILANTNAPTPWSADGAYHQIEKGDRIAQLVIQEVVYGNVQEVESFEGFTARETAGFGSTGN